MSEVQHDAMYALPVAEIRRPQFRGPLPLSFIRHRGAICVRHETDASIRQNPAEWCAKVEREHAYPEVTLRAKQVGKALVPVAYYASGVRYAVLPAGQMVRWSPDTSMPSEWVERRTSKGRRILVWEGK
jgi:hypothetical protein